MFISGISSVTDNTIIANRFYYKLGTTEYDFGDTTPFKNIYPTPDRCLSVSPTYLKGGFNAYKGTMQELSFASIFDKVNNGSPDIKYTTINEDGTVEENTFLMEFELYSTNVKADYIQTSPVIFNGVKNSDFKPIGARTVGLEKTYFTTMYRFNGNYNPKVIDVMLYNDEFDNKFNEEIRESLKFTNTQFFSTYPGFALYKQLYINKINEQNPFTVLDFNKDSALRPEWWQIGEISIDKQDSYIFRSCWDGNFHKRYDSKLKFIRYPGYIEPKEVSSFLASTIMNIPNELKIQKYQEKNIRSLVRNNFILGFINNTDELIDLIKPNLVPLFEKYVNNSFNFQKLDNLDDDINRYITTNILPRYFSNQITAYQKLSSINSNAPLFEFNKSEQELIIDGFTKVENISFRKRRFSEFEYTFGYNKPSDRNVTLAFVTDITTI